MDKLDILNRKEVTAKLGTMRKPQSFTIYPYTGDNTLTVQSDSSIGRFYLDSGKGMLNQKGSMFAHMSERMGAKAYTFPPEFVAECRAIAGVK